MGQGLSISSVRGPEHCQGGDALSSLIPSAIRHICALSSDNRHLLRRFNASILNIRPMPGRVGSMKRHLFPALALIALAGPLEAACYADYKAKKDNPLRLHYGVVALPDAACSNPAQAAGEVARKIGRDGWTLLNVLSTFGADGLEERKTSAGEFYLRF